MTWKRRTFVITSITASIAVQTLPIQAQSGRGRDPKRKGGGDRGECNLPEIAMNQGLVALVPAAGETLSIMATPTLWFYIPYASDPPLSVRLSLRDEGERRALIDPVLIPLFGTPGIISIRLPKALELDKSYHWYLTITCNPKEDGTGVDGWIRRIKPDYSLRNQLKQPLPLPEQLALYQKANAWHDQLTLLAEHISDPQAATAWVKLLVEAGLEEISQKPIVRCCMLTP